MYCEFEYLFRKMKKYEKSKLKREVDITPEKLVEFITEEIELVSNEIKCT